MLLFRKKNESFKKDFLLNMIQDTKDNCLKRENRFLLKAESGNTEEYLRMAHFCEEYADILEECAQIVSQMLPPRNKRREKEFEEAANELLDKAHNILCNSRYEQEISDGTLGNIIYKFKVLLIAIAAL